MEGIVVTDPVPAVEEPQITSAAMTGPGPAQPTATNGSGGGDGSATSCPWSLTDVDQLQNLKVNWKRVFKRTGADFIFRNVFETSPWFAEVVARLRDDPCLDICGLEIEASCIGRLVSGVRMTSLDVAILMGDLKMVQKIFGRSPDPKKLTCGSPIDQKGVRSRILSALSTKERTILYTPLHLAVVGGDSHIVDVLLEKGADVNAPNWLSQTPLDLACKMGNVTMLQQLLEKDKDKKTPLHVAVQHGDVDFMKKLPSPSNFNALDSNKRTPLHYLATRDHSSVDFTKIIQYLDQDKALDLKALDGNGLSAFYVAVICCNTELVVALLESSKGRIRVNEACDKELGPPIQIAFEGGDRFGDIQRALMECEPVKGYMERLYRDRQVYVDAANAILVGVALIASVTFASWLQLPLNYTSYFGEGGYSSSVPTPSTSDLNYVDVEHNIALRAFWVFNALSFYFAIATVVCGARSVLPRSNLFIEKTVKKLRINLLVTSVLLACAVLCVIIAFAIAGTIVLTPQLKYQWCMIVPTLVGKIVCIVSLVFLFKSMKEIYSDARENSKVVDERKDNLRDKGYIVPSIVMGCIDLSNGTYKIRSIHSTEYNIHNFERLGTSQINDVHVD